MGKAEPDQELKKQARSAARFDIRALIERSVPKGQAAI